MLHLEFISIKISKCNCLLRFTIVTKVFFPLTFSFQPQIIHNLFLFSRRFEPHCSYFNKFFSYLVQAVPLVKQCIVISGQNIPSNRGFAWVTWLRNILKNIWHFDTVTVFLWRDCCQYLVFINCMRKITFAWIWWVMQKTHLLICIF